MDFLSFYVKKSLDFGGGFWRKKSRGKKKERKVVAVRFESYDIRRKGEQNRRNKVC